MSADLAKDDFVISISSEALSKLKSNITYNLEVIVSKYNDVISIDIASITEIGEEDDFVF